MFLSERAGTEQFLDRQVLFKGLEFAGIVHPGTLIENPTLLTTRIPPWPPNYPLSLVSCSEVILIIIKRVQYYILSLCDS